MDIILISFIVLFFSIIQSIFGVGLLLFGTPTLLLLGYSYSETLWLLLPCSVVISLIQVISDYRLIEAKKKSAYLVIPSLILGLASIIFYIDGVNINKIVGVLLILIGIIKFSRKLQDLLSLVVKKHIEIYYIVIGFVHGVSNMGGGPLSVLMSTIYSKKEVIRANVAFIYLMLAIFQLVVLYIMVGTNLRFEFVLLTQISLVSYMLTSKFISKRINSSKYTFILNAMVLIYGFLAIIK
jgi:uncharacterized membrane protein YfcA